MKISKEVLEKILIAMTILAKAIQEHINNKENKRGEWNHMKEVFYCSQIFNNYVMDIGSSSNG